PSGAPSLAEIFSAAERRSSKSPEAISRLSRSAQPEGRDATSTQRPTPCASRPVQDAEGSLPVAAIDTPAPTSTRTCPSAIAALRSASRSFRINSLSDSDERATIRPLRRADRRRVGPIPWESFRQPVEHCLPVLGGTVL